MALDVRSVTGADLKAVMPELARLRIIVFRDWPYLYDGTLDYEEEYLAKFAAAPGAVSVRARGPADIVTTLEGRRVPAFVDLSGLKKGRYNLTVRIDATSGFGITDIDPAAVRVTIR